MLILSRLVGEKIIIGDDIEVTVSAVRGNVVSLAITAPREVRVDREEVRKKIVEAEIHGRNELV